ncbi:hypothetical protein AX14_010160 [Amanita brunnescens Koide BX004]|nr:hypothetical protein AX14_010160 [Amanita brunnescens Koide BX004]
MLVMQRRWQPLQPLICHPDRQHLQHHIPPGLRRRAHRLGPSRRRRLHHQQPSPWCVPRFIFHRPVHPLAAAASSIDDEPISSSFQGILGLALPLNSVIASIIPPVTGNTPDGAAWASNLFSLTPVSSAPAAHFLSLSLERPGSDRVPSLLGIGLHPSSLVSDPSAINYFPLVSDRVGIIYWKVTVHAITVYVDGVRKPVDIDASAGGEQYPTAVLDSGIPVILTTPDIANGIYGALGIGPAADGNYYVPCTTPLNMTITLDDRPEIPLHPLDLTTEPPNNNRAQYCVGMIQSSAALGNPDLGIGDMILGVPFLRNTYTVMGYDTPFPNGSFPSSSVGADSDSDSEIHPALGLLALTNAAIALEEFQTVRVLNQPLSPSGNHSTAPGGAAAPVTVGPRRLSVGIIVLVALVGFFSMCCVLFGIRWVLMRRRFGKEEAEEEADGAVGRRGSGEGEGEVKIGLRELGGSERSLVGPDKDRIVMKSRSRSFDEGEVEVRPRDRAGTGASSSRVVSEYTASSARTRVGADDFGVGGEGSRWSLVVADDSSYPLGRAIRVSQGSGGRVPAHERNPSLVLLAAAAQQQQQQHYHAPSLDAEGVGVALSPEDEESGASAPAPVSPASTMAGVGTARGRLGQSGSLAFPLSRESFLSGSTVGEDPRADANETPEQREEEQQELPPPLSPSPPPPITQPITHDQVFPSISIPSRTNNPTYPPYPPRPASTIASGDFDPYAGLATR